MRVLCVGLLAAIDHEVHQVEVLVNNSGEARVVELSRTEDLQENSPQRRVDSAVCLLLDVLSLEAQNRLEPLHRPLDVRSSFDFSRQKSQKLRQVARREICTQQRHRLKRDTPVDSTSDCGLVQSETKSHSIQVLLVLDFGYDVFQSHGFIDQYRVENLRELVTVDDKTLSCGGSEMRSVRAEFYALYPNGQFCIPLDHILDRFDSRQVVPCLPCILLQIRVKFINLMLHHASLFDVFGIKLVQNTIH